MSKYANLEDLLASGIPQKALNGTTTFEQEAVLTKASALVDSYISVRFGMPLVSWGEDLRLHTAKLAAYLLLQKRGFSPQGDDADTIRDAYDDAISWLKDVARGLATPIDVVQTTISAPQDGGPGQTMVLAPAQGSIGLSAGSLGDSATGTRTTPGTPGPGRFRGW